MSLVQGAENHFQVIYAVALRETRTRFGAHQLGYLWALAEPISFMLLLYWIRAGTGQRTPVGMDFFSFVATGFVGYKLVVQVAGKVASAINGNRSLLVYPHVQPLDLVLGRVWLETSTLLTAFAVLVSAHAVVLGRFEIDDPLTVLYGFLLATCLGAGLGLVFCMAEEIVPVIERIRGPLMQPLFFVSGLFFTAASIPYRLRQTLLWNPVLQCIEIIRDGWFRSYEAPFVEPTYVIGWVLSLLFGGLALERAARRGMQIG